MPRLWEHQLCVQVRHALGAAWIVPKHPGCVKFSEWSYETLPKFSFPSADLERKEGRIFLFLSDPSSRSDIILRSGVKAGSPLTTFMLF